MKTNIIAISLLMLISVVSLVFLMSNTLNLTGNVILQSEDYVSNNLTGEITIAVKQVDALNKDIPILILLTKDDTVVKVETTTLEKLVQLSNLKTQSETFSISLEDAFPFTFDEKGEYELLFSILDLNINIKKEFVVE